MADGAWMDKSFSSRAPRTRRRCCWLPALAGALASIGPSDRPPTPPLNYVADFEGGGMLLAVGILVALIEGGRAGLGQVLDVAMVDGAALMTAPFHGLGVEGQRSEDRGRNLVGAARPSLAVMPHPANGLWRLARPWAFFVVADQVGKWVVQAKLRSKVYLFAMFADDRAHHLKHHMAGEITRFACNFISATRLLNVYAYCYE